MEVAEDEQSRARFVSVRKNDYLCKAISKERFIRIDFEVICISWGCAGKRGPFLIAPGEEVDFVGSDVGVDVAQEAFVLFEGLADDGADGWAVGLGALEIKDFVEFGG